MDTKNDITNGNLELDNTSDTALVAANMEAGEAAVADEQPQEAGSTSDAAHAPLPSATGGTPVENSVVWSAWAKNRYDLGQRGREQYEGAQQKLWRSTAMLAIEIVHRPDQEWKAEAENHGFIVPDSSHTYMVPTVATFGSNAIDADAKKHLATFLDRQALAVAWLVGKVEVDRTTYAASEDGIDALIAVIDERGGLTKLAAEQRKAKGQKVKVKVTRAAEILLSAERVLEVREARATEFLEEKAPSAAAEAKLAIVYEDGTKTTVGVTLSTTKAKITALLAETAIIEPLVDQIGELLLAGSMVPEEESDILKDNLDDPEQPESGYRLGFRHFTCGDGLTIVVSPILASSSVVILATPREQLWPQELGQPCHFRTKERRICEANIADPERRKVFTAEWADPGETQGVFRLVVRTDAATATADVRRNVGFLIEPLRSAEGNLPLNVHEDRFKPKFSGEMSSNAWKARHNDYVAKVGKRGDKTEKQEHQLGSGNWTIVSGKKDDVREIAGKGPSTSVSVMAADFARVSKTISTLPVTGKVKVSADRNAGLCIAFATRWFDYKVFIPARTPAGDRNAMLFSPFEVEGGE